MRKLIEQIHNNGGPKRNNVRIDVLNLTIDQFDGVINNYLLEDISEEIDVVVQNGDELNEKDEKRDISENLTNSS